MPLVVMLMALIFNSVNSFINGAYLSADAVRGVDVGTLDWQSICGVLIFLLGFVINLPAVAFALWTAANLIPRAIAHHRWYLERFADYPPSRKAIIPNVL